MEEGTIKSEETIFICMEFGVQKLKKKLFHEVIYVFHASMESASNKEEHIFPHRGSINSEKR